jgi:LysM repeat protein
MKTSLMGLAALLGLLLLPATSEASTFSVNSKDTLWSIARRNGIPLRVLEAANPQLTNGKLLRGDRIVLPKKLIHAVAACVIDANRVENLDAYPFDSPASRARSGRPVSAAVVSSRRRGR